MGKEKNISKEKTSKSAPVRITRATAKKLNEIEHLKPKAVKKCDKSVNLKNICSRVTAKKLDNVDNLMKVLK